MATVCVRTSKGDNLIVTTFRCEACAVEFGYTEGYPEYCPECGEEFDATEDES